MNINEVKILEKELNGAAARTIDLQCKGAGVPKRGETTRPACRRQAAFTLLDLVVVMAALVVMAAVLLPDLKRSYRLSENIRCVSNLKQIGLGFRIYASDHKGLYPNEIALTNGGTLGITNALGTFKHFQIISNEISLPKLLTCPSDKTRTTATNWDQFSNSNLSYFFGLNASSTNPATLLAGDRNLTLNGKPLPSGVYDLATNSQIGWTPKELHKGMGNILLADGCVQRCNSNHLQQSIAHSGITNRVSVP